MPTPVPITVAHGDGIGPEIMAATLHILKEAGAALEIDTIEVGEKVYLSGNPAGIAPNAWESLRRTKVFLKAPNLVVLRSLPCLPLRVVVGYTAALARVVHCSVRIFLNSEVPARTQDETMTRPGLFVVYK